MTSGATDPVNVVGIGFRGRARYFSGMSTTALKPEQTALLNTVTPSATPNEAEIAAWRELPRDEQLRRMREALASAEASTACDATMADILAEIEADLTSDG